MNSYASRNPDIKERERSQCSLQSLLTRHPQSVFISVTQHKGSVFSSSDSSSWVWEARMQDTRGEKRKNRKERGRKAFDCTVGHDECGNSSMTQFDFSPHDVAEIFGRDSRTRYLSPAIWLIPRRPTLPVYFETASRYSPDLSSVSFLISAIQPERGARNFSKILDARRARGAQEYPSLSSLLHL